MIIVRAENLSRNYTDRSVFSGVDFQVETGQRIGLVGPNGAGKSTLLRLILKQDMPDSGLLSVHPDATVAMLAQFPDFEPGQTLLGEARRAMEHLIDWHDKMIEASHNMGDPKFAAEHDRWAKAYDHYHELLVHHGGFEFDHRIEEVLTGLGFATGDFDRPVSTFSGGQQSRVLLAKLLLKSPDLMMLDEPTNHLDIETTEWLEDYLSRQEGAVLIVSHDRYFLDKTVNEICELHFGKLTRYPGNFQQYVKLRAERHKVHEREQEKLREQIAHHADFIRRYKVGLLAKQAKSREKMIERLEEGLSEAEPEISGPRMGFGQADRTGDIVLTADSVSKAYDYPLFENVSFEIERGQRIGVLGPNGAGKSTLIKILLGELPPDTGSAKPGHNVRIGYLEQGLESLDQELTPLDVVRPEWKIGEGDERFRALLGRFGINAELAERKLRNLSGGERTRVALARICAHEVNVLALDEPTNHLDLWACEALEDSLKEFGGTVLVISHDRYFLNQIAERMIYVAEGHVRVVPGNYDAFLDWRKKRDLEAAEKNAASKPAAKSPPAAANNAPSTKRKRQFPFRKVSDIENEIAERESKVADLEASLLLPEIFTNGRKLDEVSKEIATNKERLEELMLHWEEAIELNPS